MQLYGTETLIDKGRTGLTYKAKMVPPHWKADRARLLVYPKSEIEKLEFSSISISAKAKVPKSFYFFFKTPLLLFHWALETSCWLIGRIIQNGVIHVADI